MALLIMNARIATMERNLPFAEAAVVENGRFAFVGSEQDARAFAGALPGGAFETLDCAGATMAPGFNDSHMHLFHYAKRKGSVDLSGARSVAELVEAMREALSGFDASGGRFLLGEGWNQELFTDERRFPTAGDLDRVSRDVPIAAVRACFHLAALNSKAMALLGLDRSRAAELGSLVETFPDGAPTGIIKEGTLELVKKAIPSDGLDGMIRLAMGVQGELLAKGITSVQSDDFHYAAGLPYDFMARMAEEARAGRLKLRLSEQALLPGMDELHAFFESGANGIAFGDQFKAGAVKLLADGSLGARTAYLRAPYADAPDTRGVAIYSDEELHERVGFIHSRGMPAVIHAIGDGAIDMALHAIERARREQPMRQPRHGIVHCQITDDGLIRRFAEASAVAYIQPVFLKTDMHMVYPRLGKARAEEAYAWRSFLAAGVRHPFGTDCPVEPFDPLFGLYCAVTRQDLHGRGPYRMDEAMDLYDALYAYSAEGAYATGDERVKGRIAPGFLADFALFDRDLFAAPPELLLEARVRRTYVGGELRYCRE